LREDAVVLPADVEWNKSRAIRISPIVVVAGVFTSPGLFVFPKVVSAGGRDHTARRHRGASAVDSSAGMKYDLNADDDDDDAELLKRKHLQERARRPPQARNIWRSVFC